jgi:hypothetical protein
VSAPTLPELVSRWTAVDRRLDTGALVWYRQTPQGDAAHPVIRPAVFDRYGVLRCRIRFFDGRGYEHKVFVNPDNVYVRFPGEAAT